MIKNLSKVGNSYAVIIDRAAMDLIGITPDSQVEVSLAPNGGALMISPVSADDRRARVAAGSRRVVKKYDSVFRKLAE